MKTEFTGRGWDKFMPGPRITNIEDLKVGARYLVYIPQFNARNVVLVKSGDLTGLNRPLRYGSFGIQEGYFVIWDFQLESDEYYIPQEAA